jgi:hypothetical protein
MEHVPEAIQERLARTIAAFIVKLDVPYDDVMELVLDVITIYDDYMKTTD